MSFLRRIISTLGAPPAAGFAAPAAPAALTVGRLIRRRGGLAARRSAADLAPALGEESNESWPEAGVVPAAPPGDGGPPSVRRETAVQSPVSEPRGVAGNGRALPVGPGKQEVSRVGYERIESSRPLRADRPVSNPDAKELSVQGSVGSPSEPPPLRPANPSTASAASLAASAFPQAAMRAPGDAPGAPGTAPAAPNPYADPHGAVVSLYSETESQSQPDGYANPPPYRIAASAHDAGRFSESARVSDARPFGAAVAPRQPDPAHASAHAESAPGERAAPEPAVHIGSIEIVIEAEPAARAAPAPGAAAADFSSRFYLRRL